MSLSDVQFSAITSGESSTLEPQFKLILTYSFFCKLQKYIDRLKLLFYRNMFNNFLNSKATNIS